MTLQTPWYDETTAVPRPREDPRGIDDEDDGDDVDFGDEDTD
jgi:hypothetical protein